MILSNFNAGHWKYITTNTNPADSASRLQSLNSLKSSIWFKVPTFLSEKFLANTSQPNIDGVLLPETVADSKAVSSKVDSNDQPSAINKLMTSSNNYQIVLERTRAILSYTMFFVDKQRQKQGISLFPRAEASIQHSKLVIVKSAQYDCFRF